MSSFGICIIGYIIFIVGLAMAAHLLHVHPRWIAVGVVVLLGLRILTGAMRTRRPDPPSS